MRKRRDSRYQDPETGAGQAAHYYQITSLVLRWKTSICIWSAIKYSVYKLIGGN